MKQADIVLRELRKRPQTGITPRSMLNWGIYRLGGVVYRLKKQGYNIVTKRETVKTLNGYSTYARYILK